jgi:hypothetical protein
LQTLQPSTSDTSNKAAPASTLLWARKASSPEVLEIIFGIGGDEVAHFLEWVDFAGNGVQAPVAPVTDKGLMFPNFLASPLGVLVQPSQLAV